MKWQEIKEWGRIKKGVNTTVDVGPDEIKKQAAKFGNTVDKDGRPANVSSKKKVSENDDRLNQKDPVAKNLNKFNKPQTHRDRKKAMKRGDQKHKGKLPENRCPRTRASSCQCESVNKITEAQETVTAVCVLEHSDAVEGTILFKQKANAPTLIVGKVTGLEPGEHGFHIHEFGDLSQGCESAGGHYNPDGVDHGDLEQGHVGDLGNITADDSGTANIKIVAKRVDLVGERSIVGRSIVIHKDIDDLGKGGDEESLKTGNAGDRLACGVIVLRGDDND